MKAAWFLLFALAAAAQTGTDQTGSVSGVVSDAVTHMPVKKAMVSANPNGNFGHGQGQASTTTDASGAFTLTNLQAGHYRLIFQHQSYPQARFGGAAKTVEIKAGEAVTVAMELIPGAALSGHVTDEDGDPMPNCWVQLHSAKNPEQGVQMAGGSASSQDGEYRLYGIAAGKYILAAQCGGQTAFQPRPFSAGPDPPPSRAYPTQYYPSANDAKGAQAVELTAGNEKSGVDFQMIPMPVTQVRGGFAPGGADWHGNNSLNVQLHSLADPGNRGGTSMGITPNLEKGTFEFPQVFPGSYMLFAFSNNGGEGSRIGAAQRVDVGDKPVEVTLELKRAADVSGKVEIENNANGTTKITPAQINIFLAPQPLVGMPGAQAQASDDGTFTLRGVLPMLWRLQVNGPGIFVKSAWLGGTDVTRRPLDLSSGAAGALKIVVSANTGTIRGSAPVGQVVMAQLVDEDNPFRPTQQTGVDQNGQFRLMNLAPGKYRIAVMESGGPMPDDGGQEITVGEGETVMADLKAPSAP